MLLLFPNLPFSCVLYIIHIYSESVGSKNPQKTSLEYDHGSPVQNKEHQPSRGRRLDGGREESPMLGPYG